jgi:hypothetical protein
MTTKEFAAELRKLDEDIKARDNVKMLLSMTESEYLEKKAPSPEKKRVCEPVSPSKGDLVRKLRVLFVFVIISLALLTFTLMSFITSREYMSLKDDKGKEYKEWIESIGEAESIDEIEEGWETVEAAWKKRGVKYDWSTVEELIEKSSTVDGLDHNLHQSLDDEGDEHNTKFAMKAVFFLVSLIPLVIFIKQTVEVSKEYGEEKKRYEKSLKYYAESKEYDETVYPKLVAERETKLPALRKEYAEIMELARAKLAEAEKSIALRSDYIPEYYHKNALAIAVIFERGRASSVQEALNVFEEDRRAEELAAEQRRRAEAEARQRVLQEKAAQQAKYRAEQEAKEEERKRNLQSEIQLRDKKIAARERCNHCARASKCPMSVMGSFIQSGDVCPSYIPRG